MATIKITMALSGTIKSRKVSIDGDTVSFGSDGKGTIEVDGTMGDGSNHALVATLAGNPYRLRKAKSSPGTRSRRMCASRRISTG